MLFHLLSNSLTLSHSTSQHCSIYKVLLHLTSLALAPVCCLWNFPFGNNYFLTQYYRLVRVSALGFPSKQDFGRATDTCISEKWSFVCPCPLFFCHLLMFIKLSPHPPLLTLSMLLEISCSSSPSLSTEEISIICFYILL